MLATSSFIRSPNESIESARENGQRTMIRRPPSNSGQDGSGGDAFINTLQLAPAAKILNRRRRRRAQDRSSGFPSSAGSSRLVSGFLVPGRCEFHLLILLHIVIFRLVG